MRAQESEERDGPRLPGEETGLETSPLTSCPALP